MGSAVTLRVATGSSTTMEASVRLAVYAQAGLVTSYTYDGDGLKRSENTPSGFTTLIWDGSEYLQGRG